MGRAEFVTDAPETQESTIRIRSIREPAEHHRQQGPLDGRTAANPRGESLQVTQGAGGIGEAEYGQALTRGIESEASFAGIQPGDCLQEGAVEQLLVDAPHFAGIALPCRGEFRHRILAKAQGATQSPKITLVLGQRVRAPQPIQLDAMFESAEESIGLGQGRGIITAHIPPRGQRFEGNHGRRTTEHDVTSAMHQLQ